MRIGRQEVFRHHRPPLELSQRGMREGDVRARQTGKDGEERRKARQEQRAAVGMGGKQGTLSPSRALWKPKEDRSPDVRTAQRRESWNQ